MKSLVLLLIPASAFLVLAGCSGSSDHSHHGARTDDPVADQPKASPEEEAKVATALGRLNPEDRAIAEAQQYCAVEPENRLGLMGTPVKIVVKDQVVFLCCKGCKTTAQEAPDKTLAKAQQLKAKAGESSGR
jgi:hypothetical protein